MDTITDTASKAISRIDSVLARWADFTPRDQAEAGYKRECVECLQILRRDLRAGSFSPAGAEALDWMGVLSAQHAPYSRPQLQDLLSDSSTVLIIHAPPCRDFWEWLEWHEGRHKFLPGYNQGTDFVHRAKWLTAQLANPGAAAAS